MAKPENLSTAYRLKPPFSENCTVFVSIIVKFAVDYSNGLYKR